MYSPEISRSDSVDKATLATLIFLGTEIMFFAGLISSFLILRAGTSSWPPPGQPRYPILITGFNTLFLLVSGATMFRAVKAAQGHRRKRWLLATFGFGTLFLGIQGVEWVKLVEYGMTFTSSIYGGLFYTLIGCHALHLVIALVILIFVIFRSGFGTRNQPLLSLCSLYWYFVVGIWPLLYILVYLL